MVLIFSTPTLLHTTTYYNAWRISLHLIRPHQRPVSSLLIYVEHYGLNIKVVVKSLYSRCKHNSISKITTLHYDLIHLNNPMFSLLMPLAAFGSMHHIQENKGYSSTMSFKTNPNLSDILKYELFVSLRKFEWLCLDSNTMSGHCSLYLRESRH